MRAASLVAAVACVLCSLTITGGTDHPPMPENDTTDPPVPEADTCVTLDKTNAQVERTAHNAGLHRSVETLVWLSSSVLPLERCTLLLEEHLPSGAYLDADQLLRMTEQGELPPSVVSERSDVEAGEWAAAASTALFYPRLLKQTTPGRDTIWLVNFTVPVHARYHRARSSMKHGTEALVRIPHPTVFVQCPVVAAACLPYTLPRPCAPFAEQTWSHDDAHSGGAHDGRPANNWEANDLHKANTWDVNNNPGNRQGADDVSRQEHQEFGNGLDHNKYRLHLKSNEDIERPKRSKNIVNSAGYRGDTEETQHGSLEQGKVYAPNSHMPTPASSHSFGFIAPEPEPYPSSYKKLPTCYWLPIHSFSTTEGVTLQVPVGNTDQLEIVLFVTTAVTTAAALLLLTPLLRQQQQQMPTLAAK